MAFIAFYGWKMERELQTIKTFCMLYSSFSSFFFSIHIIRFTCSHGYCCANARTNTLAHFIHNDGCTFLCFVCFWLGTKHNRHIPCNACHCEFNPFSYVYIHLPVVSFSLFLPQFIALDSTSIFLTSYIYVILFDTHHLFTYSFLSRFHSTSFHAISRLFP